MLRIGLLGASRIAPGAILEPASRLDSVEVTAVASSNTERGAKFARVHDIPHVENSYLDLVASKHVDLVYNALPPSGHMPWTVAALQAGKDVLCEKPFALNTEAAQTMVDAAEKTGQILIEAFHYRFHPLFDRILSVVNSGELGAIKELRARFDVPIPFTPGALHWAPILGGGALMDLGCYAIHWVRTVMDTEPEVVSAVAHERVEEVDVSIDAVLEFPDGVRANIGCSMAEDLPDRPEAFLVVDGTRGRLHAVNPMSPHNGHELTIAIEGEGVQEEVEGDTTYFHQMQHVLDVLAGKTKQITGGEDAVANMRVIDAIYEAAGMAPRGPSD